MTLGGFLFASLILILLTPLFGKFWPVGPDYYFTFRPVTEMWFNGQTVLYDHNHSGYFGSPWGIFLIAPTLLLPIEYGQALLTTFSLAGLVFAIRVFRFEQAAPRRNFVAGLLALGNLHTFDLFLRGNIDAIPVTGLAVSLLGIRSRKPFLLGAGLWLLSVKPVNVILSFIVILWLIRRWSRKEILKAIFPLGATFLISLPLFGLDWPYRYFQFVRAEPPYIFLQTSMWRAMEFFGMGKGYAYLISLPILIGFFFMLRKIWAGKEDLLLALSAATNLAVSPYALGSHYTLLAPAFILLAGKHKWLLALWLLTLTPLSRLFGGFELTWIDILYPLATMIACFWVLKKEKLEI
jgi:hypothetical protein